MTDLATSLRRLRAIGWDHRALVRRCKLDAAPTQDAASFYLSIAEVARRVAELDREAREIEERLEAELKQCKCVR